MTTLQNPNHMSHRKSMVLAGGGAGIAVMDIIGSIDRAQRQYS